MKNLSFLNFPLIAMLVISGCLEYYFTLRFFRILSDWVPAAVGLWSVPTVIVSFVLAVISIAEIGLLLLITLNRGIREAVWQRNRVPKSSV